MVDHGARAHAQWSASATARNWHCPGAIALAGTAPADKETEHAARGTACHQISEKCLRTGKDPVEFLGTVEQTKRFQIVIDEELVSSARIYVEYVREHSLMAVAGTIGPVSMQVEQRFSLSSLRPPFEAGGTADAVLADKIMNTLEVVDLKNGMGVVDVKGNPQLRTYALGALLANPGLPVETVTVTIVQPRAPHKDGRIRSETFPVYDLIEWSADLLDAMKRSKQALDEFGQITGELSRDAWAEKWLRPGKCKFCPAEGFCPALKKRALSVAAAWFDEGALKIGNTLDDRSPEMVAQDLDGLDMLEDWVKARRAYAHHLAESGIEIPNYQLVEKHGHRKWAADDEKVRTDLILVAGLHEDEIFDRKLKTPAAIEKVLGAKRKSAIANMWHQPVTGTNLVRVDKTNRPPAQSTAAKYFEKQES